MREVLVQRLEALTNRLNDDWEGNAMDAGELEGICCQK